MQTKLEKEPKTIHCVFRLILLLNLMPDIFPEPSKLLKFIFKNVLNIKNLCLQRLNQVKPMIGTNRFDLNTKSQIEKWHK